VISNAAYEALKAATNRVRRREVPVDDRRGPDPDVMNLVRTAPDLRCEQLGIDEFMGDGFWWPTSDGWEVLFRRGRRGRFVASVLLVVAEVHLPDALVTQRREANDDGETLRVLRAANGLEALPPE
jgi:hypothetical protein